ncbi:MAG: transposase [Solirubrobacterales bacterium]
MDDFFAYAARGTKTLYRRKPFIADAHYHVFNRRTDKATVFRTDADKQSFVDCLIARRTRMSPSGSVVPLAFAVLDNHFHLVLSQADARAITSFMRGFMIACAMRHNRRHKTMGPLFDDRYQARPIESANHLKRAIAYVHANPPDLHTSPFSSHGAYVDQRARTDAARAVDARRGLALFGSQDKYLAAFAREAASREARRSHR